MAKSKAARASTQIAHLKQKNELAHRAIKSVKAAAKNEFAQVATLGAVAGGAGAVAGDRLQKYLNEREGVKGISSPDGADYSVAIAGIPTGVFIGAALAAVGLMRPKARTKALLGGLGAGMVGGAYVRGPKA